jgi:uncharacterized membrane protein
MLHALIVLAFQLVRMTIWNLLGAAACGLLFALVAGFFGFLLEANVRSTILQWWLVTGALWFAVEMISSFVILAGRLSNRLQAERIRRTVEGSDG